MTTTTPSADVLSQSIELQLTGQSDAKYKYGAGHIRPERVVFYYIEDTKGSVNAHLFGSWVSENGEDTGDPVDQMYRHTDGDWPDWLTELSSRRKPALFNEVRRLWAKSDSADTTTAALADGLRYVLEYTGPRHNHDRPGIWDTSGKPCEHCARLTTIREHLTAYEAAPAAVLPQPADRAAEEAYRLTLSTALRLGTGATWEAIRDRAEDLVAEAAELTEARETNRRLNLRAQKLESELATYYRAVGQWEVSKRGTYVPLRTIAAIAKAAGRDIETPQWLLHYQRVEQAEAAIERVRDAVAFAERVVATSGPGPASAVQAVIDRLRAALDPHQPAVVAAVAGEAEAPWATDGARIGRVLIWSWANVGDTDFGQGYRTAQEDVRSILTRPLLTADEAQQQPDTPAALTPCTCRQAVHAREHKNLTVPDCPWCAPTPDIRPNRPTAARTVDLTLPEPAINQEAAAGERVVAYRSALPGALSVYCTNHTDELGSGVTPLTSDDLPNGGMCASCGADVLIPPASEPGP